MRILVIATVLALGCTGTGLPNSGGDGGGSNADLAGADFAGVDFAGVDLAQPQPDFAGVDFAGMMCAATCQHCQGVCCGAGCCAVGEWCDSASNTCHCGQGPACSNGEFCATGGPLPGPGSNQCGVICCGGAGHPCPL